MDQLQIILSERPAFHRSETEINRPFSPSESLLPAKIANQLASPSLTCYGIGSDVLSFIAESIGPMSRTLETGAGCSTLVFAIKRSTHIAITPNELEFQLIAEYAKQKQIPLDKVQFVPESSDQYLPRCEFDKLDLVLLDGKHAFPWPIVDWFYTAEKLRNGGIMIVDDAQLRSVAILAQFMKVDPGWQLLQDFSGKTLVFKKLRESIHDVAWHMQPFVVSRLASEQTRVHSFIGRAFAKVVRLVRG